jgi:hypothetical protein
VTFKIQKENIADKILALIGKRRAVRLPVEAYDKFGIYVYAQADKESFWRVLFRNKNNKLPDGRIYPVKY